MKKLFVILIFLFSFTLLAISQDSLQNKPKSRTFDAKIYAKDKEAVLVIVEKLIDAGHGYISIKRIILWQIQSH